MGCCDCLLLSEIRLSQIERDICTYIWTQLAGEVVSENSHFLYKLGLGLGLVSTCIKINNR